MVLNQGDESDSEEQKSKKIEVEDVEQQFISKKTDAEKTGYDVIRVNNFSKTYNRNCTKVRAV